MCSTSCNTGGANSQLQPAALKLRMPLAASSQPGCRRLQATPVLYEVERTYGHTGVTTNSLGGRVPPNIEKIPICPPHYTAENMSNICSLFMNPVNGSVSFSVLFIFNVFLFVRKNISVWIPPPNCTLVWFCLNPCPLSWLTLFRQSVECKESNVS